MVEAGNGVKVTGGRQTQVENGLAFTADADGANPKLRIIQNNANKLQFNDSSTTSLQPLTINPDAGRGLALSFNAPNTTESISDGGAYMNFQANQTGATFDGKFSFLKISTPVAQDDAVVACSDMAGVRIDNGFGRFNAPNDGNSVAGLRLQLNTRTDKIIYNIEADGSAPNFLAGDTHNSGPNTPLSLIHISEPTRPY